VVGPEPVPGAWLARQPAAAPALDLGTERLACGELLARVEALAGWLARAPLAPRATLATVTRSAELLALLAHAAPRAGLALLPLGPALPRETRASLLQTCRAGAVLCDAREDASGAPWLAVDEALAAARAAGSAPAPGPPLAGHEVHLVCATSGTGGTPKGVLLTGDNLRAAVTASAARVPLAAGDAWLACVALHHIAGLAILNRCAAAGAEVVLHPRFDPARVTRDLGRRPVSHLSLVPAMLARLLDEAAGRPPPPGLRVVLVGGGPLSAALLRRARRAGWPVCPTYGLTEAASQVATLYPPPGEDWRPGLVGAPLDGLAVRIGAPGADGTGLVEIRGPMVTVGYASPEGPRGIGLADGWLATRDLGRLDGEGRLTVVGRADEVLVSGGENVHPVAVEQVLADCPGAGEVAVTARSDPVWGDRLVAVWTGPASPATVEGWARERLHGAWRPREFRRLAALPQGGPGKLDRRALRRLVET
jgi:O-succinylbenzoic acid--CoA ligase